MYKRQAAQGNKKGFAEALSAGLRALFILLVPATVGLWVLRYPIVRLAFERGSFDATDTAKTAFALGFYALGLLGLSAGTVLTRAFTPCTTLLRPSKSASLPPCCRHCSPCSWCTLSRMAA